MSEMSTVYALADFYDSIPTVTQEHADAGIVEFPFKWLSSSNEMLVRGYQGELDTQVIIKMAGTPEGRVKQMRKRGQTCERCKRPHILHEIHGMIEDNSDPEVKRLMIHYLCQVCFTKAKKRVRKKRTKQRKSPGAAKVDAKKLRAERKRHRSNRKKNRRK